MLDRPNYRKRENRRCAELRGAPARRPRSHASAGQALPVAPARTSRACFSPPCAPYLARRVRSASDCAPPPDGQDGGRIEDCASGQALLEHQPGAPLLRVRRFPAPMRRARAAAQLDRPTSYSWRHPRLRRMSATLFATLSAPCALRRPSSCLTSAAASIVNHASFRSFYNAYHQCVYDNEGDTAPCFDLKRRYASLCPTKWVSSQWRGRVECARWRATATGCRPRGQVAPAHPWTRSSPGRGCACCGSLIAPAQVEQWDEQRENGSYAGPVPGEKKVAAHH